MKIAVSKLDDEKKSKLDDGTKPPENCTPHSLEEFPDDLFTAEQRRQGAVALHAFFSFYCFLMTAFVCNDYLLPSLDCICTHMKISSDVAGATFLAAASSFPELFVNMIGTFLTESDLGVGTVMGSAVFDTFATPACGALSAFHVSASKTDIVRAIVSNGCCNRSMISRYENLISLISIYLVVIQGV